ncbi:DUF1294 domain-containing protein [Aeromicrobium sp. Leaf350]|uniref:DUF1294 domain-containing protein n=1 Tax=Aeromicrobium sp. Leaf350 TaxID=2876565 RepID=UPI001E4A5E31|nr:DUF1294 domain-containing protein [Aeromicrobium sp. Leaf350]
MSGSSARQQGVLSTWNDDRGFGFIAPAAGGPRVFAHVSAFPSGRRPTAGRVVTATFIALAILVELQRLPLAVFVAYGLVSVLAFLMYRADKLAARRGAQRAPERVLHLAGLLGGWPGALLARHLLRHKTVKQPFRTVFWLTVCVNGAVLTAFVVSSWPRS